MVVRVVDAIERNRTGTIDKEDAAEGARRVVRDRRKVTADRQPLRARQKKSTAEAVRGVAGQIDAVEDDVPVVREQHRAVSVRVGVTQGQGPKCNRSAAASGRAEEW